MCVWCGVLPTGKERNKKEEWCAEEEMKKEKKRMLEVIMRYIHVVVIYTLKVNKTNYQHF